MSSFQELKITIVALTGLAQDALHVYLGLVVMFGVALALGKSLRSAVPWFAVVLVALLLELPDLRDDFASFGHWRWQASVRDFVNTIFWPTVILFLARNRALFGSY